MLKNQQETKDINTNEISYYIGDRKVIKQEVIKKLKNRTLYKLSIDKNSIGGEK